ncbi:hypothetical protein [uncultured Amphritea sp.]|uniref:hypothetical protein n=1 Tax=uncultured Amphritea sp. TaxID=981605 RepID=UPI0025EB9447|nr:hypothetical protein [uncultured Amphritea sp.]
MEHKVIDQTSLVHGIISFRSDFEIHGQEKSCDVESYKWYLIGKTTGSEAVVIQWQDQTWEGVRAA